MAAEKLRNVSGNAKLVVGIVSGAEFVNHMFLVLLPPILGILTEDFRTTISVLGLAMGFQRFSTTIFQLPFGWVADTYGRVLSMGLAIWIGGAGVFVVALSPSIPVLFLGVALIGLGIAGHHPSHYPLISGAVPETVRARAFSMRGFTGALGFGTPPALITAVLTVPGLTWRHALALIGVLGVLYGVAAFLLLRRITDDSVETEAYREDTVESESRRTRIYAELTAILSSPAVLAVAFLSFVWSLTSNGITSYTVVMLTDGYGLNLGTANLTFSIMFGAGAVMALVGGILTDRFSAGSVLLSTIAVVGVLLALFASLLLPAALVIPVAITIGGVRMAGGPSRSTLIDRFSDPEALGRSFAVMTIGLMLGGAVGPSVFGILIDNIGLQVAFLTMCGVALIAFLIALGIVVRYDNYAVDTVRRIRS